jgi:hypothetical protein
MDEETWSPDKELLLRAYAEEAQVCESMHRRSMFRYKTYLKCFRIPLICISAINGGVQLLSESFPAHRSVIIGCTAATSILVSLLGSVMSYLKLGELFSNHKTSRVLWQKLFDTIRYQLALSRDNREDGDEFLHRCRTEYRKLIDISPPIDKTVIAHMKKRLAGLHDQFAIPNYCNGVARVRIYNLDQEPDVL